MSQDPIMPLADDADLKARAVSKQILLIESERTNHVGLEALGKDESFNMPPDLRMRSLTKSILIALGLPLNGTQVEVLADAGIPQPGTVRIRSTSVQVLSASTPKISDSAVEALGLDTSHQPQGTVRIRSTAVTTLYVPTLRLEGMQIEVLGSFSDFKPTADLKAKVRKSVLITNTPRAELWNSGLEVLGHGELSKTVNHMQMEVLGQGELSKTLNEMQLEVLGESTIIPPRITQEVTWFML